VEAAMRRTHFFPVITAAGPGFTYDVAGDGQRFVVVQPPEASGEQSNAITMVTNWQAGLR
jgi:hypothetical protein